MTQKNGLRTSGARAGDHKGPVELSHVEQESAAFNAYLAAGRRKDQAEADRLWKVFTKLHAKRPAAVVAAMERAKGLR